MVWILTGQVQNADSDDEHSIPASTSHYLRPGRSYRLGRMAYTTTATQGKKALPIKPRLLDFRLKTTQISKEGAWDLQCEGDDWDENDDPLDPRNGAPYALTIRAIKRLTVHRAGEDKPIEPGSQLWLESGDVVHFSKYNFSVEWKPFVVCVTSAVKSDKPKFAAQAKALGIKLAYQTFLPHHTHLILNKVQPSTNLCTAAMSTALIASPELLSDLFTLATPPQRPHNIPPPPTALTASESIDPEAVKKHATAMSAWEASLLRLDPDAGSDWQRWWGKCALEKDWNLAPTGLEPDGRYQPRSDQFDLGVLAPDERRRTLWRGTMVISFRRNRALDEADQRVFELGGGSFFACHSLDDSVTVASLENELERFQPQNGAGEVERYAIIPPAQEWSIAEQAGELPEQGVLRELAQRLGVGKYLSQDGEEIMRAVYEIDSDRLFPAPPPPIFEVGATPQSVATTGRGLSMPPATGRTVVGATYPQSTAGISQVHSSQLLPTEPVTSQTTESQAPATLKRKLVRRGKQTQSASMILDEDMWGPPPVQQDTQAKSQPTASATQAVDLPSSIPQSIPAPAATQKKGRLKRRAGTVQEEPFTFLDNLNSTSSPAKKPRVEPAAVPEVDEEHELVTATRKKRETQRAKTESPTQRRTDKRRSTRDPSSDDDAPPPATKRAKTPAKALSSSPPSSPPPTRPPATAAEKRKAAKEAKALQEEEAQQFLVVKTSKRNKASEQQLAEDFNALKIVKPTLKYAKPTPTQRMSWKELDREDAEVAKLVEEDEDRLDHPELWRVASQSMFVVKTLDATDRRNKPRTDLPLDPRWEGRQNFKKFRPKNQQAVGVPRVSTVKVALGKLEPLPPTQDFGLGAKYESTQKKKKATKVEAPSTQSGRLGRVAEQEDLEEEDELMLDEEDESSATRRSKSQTPTVVGSSHSRGSTASRPRQEEVLVLDSDDDSDSGLTFRGFGKSKRR